nr:hypothetical protein [Tanacetum cinerariifolium]
MIPVFRSIRSHISLSTTRRPRLHNLYTTAATSLPSSLPPTPLPSSPPRDNTNTTTSLPLPPVHAPPPPHSSLYRDSAHRHHLHRGTAATPPPQLGVFVCGRDAVHNRVRLDGCFTAMGVFVSVYESAIRAYLFMWFKTEKGAFGSGQPP